MGRCGCCWVHRLAWQVGWGSISFFSSSFLFRFIYFFHFLCYGAASSMHMESITLPRLITFNEGSTTRHLKKVKESVGKTRAATG
jgi:hypothetical protein